MHASCNLPLRPLVPGTPTGQTAPVAPGVLLSDPSDPGGPVAPVAPVVPGYPFATGGRCSRCGIKTNCSTLTKKGSCSRSTSWTSRPCCTVDSIFTWKNYQMISFTTDTKHHWFPGSLNDWEQCLESLRANRKGTRLQCSFFCDRDHSRCQLWPLEDVTNVTSDRETNLAFWL